MRGQRTGCCSTRRASAVRAALLDHDIPCLGFALEEKLHLNVWKNRLQELGLPTGPWLQELKRLVRRGAPDDTPVRVHWRGSQRRDTSARYPSVSCAARYCAS
ncbi:MAG: hypothetical protein MZV65_41185 [Chromatiales bacterium]|nr:hypothetical protein [Chromatiales bacterium]